jgi:hypothetical protein
MSRLSQIKGAANMEPRFSRSRATSSAFEAQLSKAADEREILNEGAAKKKMLKFVHAIPPEPTAPGGASMASPCQCLQAIPTTDINSF